MHGAESGTAGDVCEDIVGQEENLGGVAAEGSKRVEVGDGVLRSMGEGEAQGEG